ncbi:hypothetical protein C8R46DRAFT_1031830 [Mycena filopes]|nr:hypothetical protein C8R46DRAFT_1031830 [Mycena filopes]
MTSRTSGSTIPQASSSTMSQSPNEPLTGLLTQHELLLVKIQERKRDQARAKTRERMVRYRMRLKSAPPEEQEATKKRARYRAKEFGNKFGLLAFEAKLRRRYERKQEKLERQRRRTRRPTRPQPVAQSDADDDDEEDDETERNKYLHRKGVARRRAHARTPSSEDLSDPQAPISPGWEY